ncbi:disease resistance protein At4g27190-like [Lotus japonicus]|uniref:disease resistance protein At4g27190-like n=1 Tax=Lotus japonicus TaxID=34305 RepID=UPI00258E9C1C|nr:disease resistance protein At4g27190-like [Lotus japonicus]
MSGFEVGIGKLYTNIRGKVASSKNLDELNEILVKDIKMLLAIQEDKERQVQRNKQKDTTNAYKLWTNLVSKAAGEVQKLITEYDTESLPWWCILRRSRLSEKMTKMYNCVHGLMTDAHSRDFLVDKLPERVLKELGVPHISGYPTLQISLEKILGFLKNSKIKVIGVCGTKGVGKTTILHNLNNNEEVAKMFDIVIFVRITADEGDDQKIQEKIANRLMLDITTIQDHADVARTIYNDLANKKYLLILDGVVGPTDFEHLGIPSDKNGSKVVISSQFLRDCKLNGVERVIKVKELSPDEAWKMFRDIVCDNATSHMIDSPDIQPIAHLVCNRCSRLPLLIHKIANSFKLKGSASSWWAGLEDLKPWPELQNQGLKELFSFLKFCYDELKDEKKQKCFLYTSMYPTENKIYTDYLVECWAAQGLLGDINDARRYRSARNRGIDILEHLTDVSLLEKGEQMTYVKMNDCMRQLALFISSKDPECSFYLQEREETENVSNSRAWQQVKWVSMIDRKMLDLPANQDFSMVLTLLLQKNPELTTIPQTFFESMNTLLLLDLYGTGIRELPSSLSKLTCLRALFLNNCVFLRSLPSEIGSFQWLEVLDILDTKVPFIPIHIGYLNKLRCLRISFIASDEENKVENFHVISKLQRLEELTIQVISYEQWSNDAEGVLQQVALLENLTTLKCCFPSPDILRNFLQTSKSWRGCEKEISFRFFVGCQNSRRPQILGSFEHKITNYLKYCNGELKDDFTISEILPNTDALELICHKDIRRLSNFVGTRPLNRIRGLLIEKCNKFSTIVVDDLSCNPINGIQSENRALLPNLEQLYLENLLNLTCAFRGPVHIGTLAKLQILSLKNCPYLSEIFSNGALQHFSELQKLKIEDCAKLEELIVLREGSQGERHVLPKLEMLLLVNLPNFKSICSNQTLDWPSLELLRIHRCPNLKTLPFDASNATNLRSIEGEQKWWDELKWTNNSNEERLLHLACPSAKRQR